VKRLEKFNTIIDERLVRLNLKKKTRPVLEQNLTQFVQTLLMNINGGLILEKALQKTIDATSVCKDLQTAMHMHQSAVVGFNHYAATLGSDSISRLARLINQAHQTGSRTLEDSLEKMYESIWTEQINRFRKKSEKVSIQLTFLLMLSLISVIVVVISPILLIL
jgi:hypothetical protein